MWQPWKCGMKTSAALAAGVPFARDVGNYNMLYRTLMAAISYLPNPLVSIKLVSILFDYIGAAAAALLAHEVCRQAG